MKISLDSQQSDDARIELIPLVDVIFCILTFFILASLGLSRQQAINVNLPSAKTGQVQPPEMLIVSIDNFGQTYIEQQPVNPQQFRTVVESYQKARPDGMMVLYAPKEARYNDVVQVLDILRAVGGSRVALATLPDPTNSPSPNSSSPNLSPPFNPGNSNVPSATPTAPGVLNPGAPPAPQNPLLNPGSLNLPPAAPVIPNPTTAPTQPNRLLNSPGGSNNFPSIPTNPNPSFSPTPGSAATPLLEDRQ